MKMKMKTMKNNEPRISDESVLAMKGLMEAVLRNLALKEISCQLSNDGNYLTLEDDPTSIIIPTKSNDRLNKQQSLVQTFLDHPDIKSFVFAIVASDSSVVYYRIYRGLGEEGEEHSLVDLD
jgi:hypothetical protein